MIVLDSVEKSGGADRLVCSHGDPCHGVTLVGATPDDGILSHLLSDPIGVVDVGCP